MVSVIITPLVSSLVGDDCSKRCNLAHGCCDQDGKCRYSLSLALRSCCLPECNCSPSLDAVSLLPTPLTRVEVPPPLLTHAWN